MVEFIGDLCFLVVLVSIAILVAMIPIAIISEMYVDYLARKKGK